MHLVQAAVLACALGAPTDGETVLLDFTAAWCGPCKQMQPVVDRLAAQGVPIRKVDIDAEPALARRFNVDGVPCFVMLVAGRETGRIVGATSYESLAALHRDADPQRPAPDLAAAVQRAQAATAPTSTPAAVTQPLIDQLLQTSVRIKINDGGGQSVGTGTIVDAREGEALVLTCGHIFRDSEGKGRITVDLFGPGAPSDVPARVVGYDLESDLGFISFRPGTLVPAAKIAPAGYRAKPNDSVVSIGCNHGDDATPRVSRVTSIDKFLGPPNLQVAGQPVQGRSGGGLFSAEGYLIGVCNAGAPEDDEGLFAALPAIHAELNQLGLSKFCLPIEPIVAAAPPPLPARMPAFGSADPTLGTIPTSSVGFEASPAAAVATSAASPTLPTGPIAGAGHDVADLAHLPGGAEVVCIVRSRDDPQAPSRTIVIDRASPEFMARLIEASQRTPASTAGAASHFGPGR